MRANDHLTMMQISDTGTIIKENRDIAAAGERGRRCYSPQRAPKLAWNTLPVAVRDAIECKPRPTPSKTLMLTNYWARPLTWSITVDKDAIRNRLYVNKAGSDCRYRKRPLPHRR